MLIDGDDVETNGVSTYSRGRWQQNRVGYSAVHVLHVLLGMQVHVVMSLTLLGDV